MASYDNQPTVTWLPPSHAEPPLCRPHQEDVGAAAPARRHLVAAPHVEARQVLAPRLLLLQPILHLSPGGRRSKGSGE